MKCPKCSAEVKDSAKFCKNCGEKISVDIEKEKIAIEKDNKDIKENKQEESKQETKSDIYSSNNSNIDKSSNKVKEKISKIWSELNLFEKGLSILGVVIIFAFIVALIMKKNAPAIISFIQMVGIIITFLIERKIIKTPYKWIKIVIPSICILMIFAYMSCFTPSNISNTNATQIIWSEMVLGYMIPEPQINGGHIYYNSDEKLYVELYNTTSKQYYDYIESCKKNGFNIDVQKNEYSYSAFTNDGYELELNYSEYSKKMDIKVTIVKKLGEFIWSEKELAKLIPIPRSTIGEIIVDTDKEYKVIIGNTTLQNFEEYVSLCKEKGFMIEENKQEKSFTAKNKDSNKLLVEYIGNNTIQIALSEPEYKVALNVKCIENLIFSKYDVKVYIDDSYEDTLSHGTDEDYELKLTKGKHTFKFVSNEDADVKGETKIEILNEQNIQLEIRCYSTNISINNKTINEETKQEESKQEEPQESVSYSTNNTEKAKEGNAGVYSYVKKGNLYDIYYIIDFDEGYVYYFLEGEDNTFCDKVKIKSGDLNSTLLFTYHDGDSAWDEALHFKYKNQPNHLIYEDGNHLEWDYYTTDLTDSLKLREKKNIKTY